MEQLVSPSAAFWYDGALFENGDRPAFIDDEGLRFGATVFTTLRVYGHRLDHPLTQWQRHCDRLTYSTEYFNWQAPNWINLKKGAQHLAGRYPILRITLFSDGREWILGRQLPLKLGKKQRTGVTGWVAPAEYSRSLPSHKTGNYLACWLARQQGQQQGADEAILTSSQGDWLETATGNLWGFASGQWFTPMHEGCLPGIMRNQLSKILRESGQIVDPRPWTQALAESFEAIAYSNCAIQLLPIHTILIEGTTLKYNPGHPSLRALHQQVSNLAHLALPTPERL